MKWAMVILYILEYYGFAGIILYVEKIKGNVDCKGKCRPI